jgi:putative membrane protein
MTKLLTTASLLALLAAPALAQTGTTPGAGPGGAANPPASPSMNRSMDSRGDTTTRGNRNASSTLDKPDRDFVREAAQAGMEEIQEGQMAQQHAQNPDVKAFGQKMIDDHTQINDKLKAIAQQKSVQVPSDVNKSEKQATQKLEKAKNFDREYVRAQVREHEKAVKLFDKEAKDGKDPDLKQFAQQTLPTLQQHLQMAKDLEQKTRPARTETSQAPRSDRGSAGTSASPATSGSPRTTR